MLLLLENQTNTFKDIALFIHEKTKLFDRLQFQLFSIGYVFLPKNLLYFVHMYIHLVNYMNDQNYYNFQYLYLIDCE